MQVLIVEDDPGLSEFLVRVLAEEGASSKVAETLASARALLAAESFEVIVLDWMLPDGEGVELCTAPSPASSSAAATPILMLTARGEVRDRVKGLRAGADDYLVKPFEVEEFLARLDALVRRSSPPSTLRVGALEIDRLSRRATIEGKPLELTVREYDLLLHLAMHAECAVPRSQLLAEVLHFTFEPGSGVLDVNVSRLRDKLGRFAWMVQTVRGVGYVLQSAPPP